MNIFGYLFLSKLLQMSHSVTYFKTNWYFIWNNQFRQFHTCLVHCCPRLSVIWVVGLSTLNIKNIDHLVGQLSIKLTHFPRSLEIVFERSSDNTAGVSIKQALVLSACAVLDLINLPTSPFRVQPPNTAEFKLGPNHQTLIALSTAQFRKYRIYKIYRIHISEPD